MKRQRLIGFVIAVFCFSTVPHTASAQNFSDTFFSFHSSICEAINPSQSERMTWNQLGLINNDPNLTLWVMCPIPTAFYNNFTQDSFFGLVAENVSDVAINLQCILRYWQNQVMRSEVKTIYMAANGGRGEFYWEVYNTQLVGPAVQCNLPPSTAVVGLVGGAAVYN